MQFLEAKRRLLITFPSVRLYELLSLLGALFLVKIPLCIEKILLIVTHLGLKLTPKVGFKGDGGGVKERETPACQF